MTTPTHATVVLFKPSGKYYTEEQWAIPTDEQILAGGGSRGDRYYPGVMRYSPDFRRIDGGAVHVETQEPWGHPGLIPSEGPRAIKIPEPSPEALQELALHAGRLMVVPEHEKSLEDMQAEVVAWAQRKGWHDPDENPATVTLAEKTNPTFGEAMALITSEVSEALEAYRDWGLDDATGEDKHDSNGCDLSFAACRCIPGPTPAKPKGVGSEFADVLIRLFHYAELFGVDLRFEYERKMAYNERRPFRHGGKPL
jgi:NTP pyrophosphatase (non-canonical NTP hydrolase)